MSIFNTGTLIENGNWATKLTNKRRKYVNQTPAATAATQYSTYGDSGEWKNQQTITVPYVSGVRDGTEPGFDPRTKLWQTRQLFPVGEKAVRRWDMINPYWQTAQTPFANNAANIELIVNGASKPLPFANDNFDQIEAQALDERFESYKDPLSARYAAYAIYPELEQVELEYQQTGNAHAPSARRHHYRTHHKKKNRPIDFTNRWGYTDAHKLHPLLKSGKRDSAKKPVTISARPVPGDPTIPGRNEFEPDASANPALSNRAVSTESRPLRIKGISYPPGSRRAQELISSGEQATMVEGWNTARNQYLIGGSGRTDVSTVPNTPRPHRASDLSISMLG